ILAESRIVRNLRPTFFAKHNLSSFDLLCNIMKNFIKYCKCFRQFFFAFSTHVCYIIPDRSYEEAFFCSPGIPRTGTKDVSIADSLFPRHVLFILSSAVFPPPGTLRPLPGSPADTARRPPVSGNVPFRQRPSGLLSPA